MKSNKRHIECQEDEDFMAAFDKMLEDTSKARNNESIKVPQFDVPVPVNLKGSKKKFGKRFFFKLFLKQGLIFFIILFE